MGHWVSVERDGLAAYLDSFDILGIGMPNSDHMVTKAIGQHGDTHVASFWKPRVVGLVTSLTGCDPVYVARKAKEWDDVLNPEMFGSDDIVLGLHLDRVGEYRLYGLTYEAVDVVYSTSAEATKRKRAWQFTTDDPIWYGASHTQVFGPTVAVDELAFPAEFPIEFGMDRTIAENYTLFAGGNWFTYPMAVFTGPMTNPGLLFYSTGGVFQLNYTIAAGETVVAVFKPGHVVVVNTSNVSLLDNIAPASTLPLCYLAPTVYNATGNTVRGHAAGCTVGVSMITLTWEDAYVGL